MKTKVALFTLVFVLSSISIIAYADDISDLKEQVKQMQSVIEKQSKQMAEMQNKLEKLEGVKASQIKAPQGMEERVEALEEKVSSPNTFRSYWKDGLRFATDDGAFSLAMGGRIQADTVWMQEDSAVKGAVGDATDGAEFRRARLYASGTIYDNLFYKAQYDFAGGDADFVDVYMGAKNIPYLGTIKVGHFQQPFCMDDIYSSKYITFMERSIVQALTPGYELGISAYSTAFDDRMTWAVSTFRITDSFGSTSSNEYNLAARVTALPVYEDNGEKLLHVGFGYSFINPENTLQYEARPEVHLAPYYTDTGAFAAKHANLVGGELAGVYGPLSFQGELIQSFVDETSGPDDTYFYGAYGQLSYFLTGEIKPYSKTEGVFSRVRPKQNFSFEDRTWGAWELAARYSHLDLKDNAIDGGIMSDTTLGVNWYLNPNMRIMWNYVHSNLNGVGTADAFLSSVRIDF
ncbi:MAG: porin [Candidatus Omnitrophota bacterium]